MAKFLVKKFNITILKFFFFVKNLLKGQNVYIYLTLSSQGAKGTFLHYLLNEQNLLKNVVNQKKKKVKI